MIAARQIAFGKAASKGLSAKSYIQDGLVAMWDGIENAGWGVHDPSATVWKNLVKGDSFKVKSGNYFTADSVITTVNTDYGVILTYGIQDGSGYTFECVGASLSPGSAVIAIPYSGGANFSVYPNWRAKSSYIKACGGNLTVDNSGPTGTRKSFGLKVDGDNWTIFSEQFSVTKAGTWTKTSSKYGGYIQSNAECCNIRLYNRALTAEEIAYNYEIDKARFGL
jgi:hypothetical protein